jgi:hypothetical protein
MDVPVMFVARECRDRGCVLGGLVTSGTLLPCSGARKPLMVARSAPLWATHLVDLGSVLLHLGASADRPL